MKILVIGREGRLGKYTRDKSKMDAYDIVYASPEADDKELIVRGGDADFILVDAMAAVSKTVIESMPNLKMIHSEGVGFNKIDTDAARERGIYVCNCKGMNAAAVAEQAVCLMLCLLRDVCNGDRSVRNGEQISVKENIMLSGSLREMGDCTIGLVGFGDIAKETACFVSPFGARLLYNARKTHGTIYGAEYAELDTLLKESDIVSLHLPVTKDTAGMVNAEFLAKMKKGAYLVNTARGDLVDSDALIQAIRSGHIAGAGLDTVAGEPVRKDNPLLTAEEAVESKIIFSCHIGGVTASSFARGYDMFWSDLEKVAAGDRPERIVNGL